MCCNIIDCIIYELIKTKRNIFVKLICYIIFFFLNINTFLLIREEKEALWCRIHLVLCENNLWLIKSSDPAYNIIQYIIGMLHHYHNYLYLFPFWLNAIDLQHFIALHYIIIFIIFVIFSLYLKQTIKKGVTTGC